MQFKYMETKETISLFSPYLDPPAFLTDFIGQLTGWGNAEQWSYIAQPSRSRTHHTSLCLIFQRTETLSLRLSFFQCSEHFWATKLWTVYSLLLLAHPAISVCKTYLGYLFWPRTVRKTKYIHWHAHIVWKLDQSSLTLLISLVLLLWRACSIPQLLVVH